MRSTARSQIIAVLGEPAAQKLFEAYGGKRLYVPTIPRLSRSHRIAQSIGYGSALLLSQEWGGQLIDVPIDRLLIDQQLRERNQRILQARSTMPRSDMVVHFRLCRRRIEQILAAR